jgi:hypothetical protein
MTPACPARRAPGVGARAHCVAGAWPATTIGTNVIGFGACAVVRMNAWVDTQASELRARCAHEARRRPSLQ